MAKVTIKWRRGAFYDVRRDPALVDMLEAAAEKIAEKANDDIGDVTGYPSGTQHYRTGSRQGAKRPYGRWRATVVTATVVAKRHDAKHDTLLKALAGGV